VRSGPGAARTILIFHIIRARPSKQAGMVGSTLAVDSFALISVSARTIKRHHHQRMGALILDALLAHIRCGRLGVVSESSIKPRPCHMVSLSWLAIETTIARPCDRAADLEESFGA
jgi:hypothetical protein